MATERSNQRARVIFTLGSALIASGLGAVVMAPARAQDPGAQVGAFVTDPPTADGVVDAAPPSGTAQPARISGFTPVDPLPSSFAQATRGRERESFEQEDDDEDDEREDGRERERERGKIRLPAIRIAPQAPAAAPFPAPRQVGPVQPVPGTAPRVAPQPPRPAAPAQPKLRTRAS